MPDSTRLPQPQRERWQPLRCGLLELYYYDREELWFRDGHLLLRGNNGTGKSKVLALTLPFLLDAELASARMEPDGDRRRRMEWNLLPNDQDDQRTGYTWVEFGRLDARGEAHFTILGCGVKAVRGRKLKSWFFISDQRVGEALRLEENGVVLEQSRLAAHLAELAETSLGGYSRIFTTARDYRAAVDQRLFGLGPERYRILMDMLIQLRQPQLSKNPNPVQLSKALTEALPPLEETVLQQVAESFRELENEQAELEGLGQTLGAVSEFQQHYQRYVRIAARRLARRVRQSQTKVDKAADQVRQDEQQLAALEQRCGELDRERGQLAERIEEAGGRHDALRESELWGAAQQLDLADTRARELASDVKEAQRRLSTAEQELNEQRQRLQALEKRLLSSGQRTREAANNAHDRAERAAMDKQLARFMERLQLPDGPAADDRQGPDLAELDASQRYADGIAEKQLKAVRLLQADNRELERHRSALADRQRQTEQAEEQLSACLEQREESLEQVQGQAQALVEAFLDYLSQSRELVIADADPILADLRDWTQSLTGDNPARQAAQTGYNRITGELAAEQAAQEQQQQGLRAQVTELGQERDALQAGQDPLPPTAPQHDAAQRQRQPGAPLWQLVDFRDDLDDQRRAGLEAALQASGLLDAWVQPDGRLLDADTLETILLPDATLTQYLGMVLRPAIDPNNPRVEGIREETLAAILRSIGFNDPARPINVCDDGHWRLGPMRGYWRKPQAELTGYGSRQAARQRRLTEIARQLSALAGELDDLEGRLRALDQRRNDLAQDWKNLPDDQPLREAHLLAGRMQQEVVQAQERLSTAEQARQAALEAVEEQLEVCDTHALELDLPAETDALHRVETAIGDYREAARDLWSSVRDHWRNLGDRLHECEREERIAQRLEQERTLVEEKIAQARQARVHFETLDASQGKAVKQLKAELAEVDTQLKRLKGEHRICNDEYTQQTAAKATQQSELTTHRQVLDAMRAERVVAVEALGRFIADGLLPSVDADLEDPTAERRDRGLRVEAGLQLARQIEQLLSKLNDSDAAWETASRHMFTRYQELEAALSRQNYNAYAEQRSSEMIVVRIQFQSTEHDPGAMQGKLAGEIEARREILSAREREIIETHLINEVAAHLQQRIQATEQQVDSMNRELQSRPTSTGMQLRFVWRELPEGEEGAPVGLKAARERLLRQTTDAWSLADREAVGRFLQSRIRAFDQVGEGTRLENLQQALDYRHWHRFEIERKQQGKWRPAYLGASGGEKVLATYIPLFAAAASHYAGAGKHAPALILLDEAFAGVDDNSRANCMGLLSHFDLDYVMTSEREWGCYPQVPGLSICQLTRMEGIDAIHVSRWTWDGKQREKAADPHSAPTDDLPI